MVLLKTSSDGCLLWKFEVSKILGDVIQENIKLFSPLALGYKQKSFLKSRNQTPNVTDVGDMYAVTISKLICVKCLQRR